MVCFNTVIPTLPYFTFLALFDQHNIKNSLAECLKYLPSPQQSFWTKCLLKSSSSVSLGSLISIISNTVTITVT